MALSISVISHNQLDLVSNLLQDLNRCTGLPFEVILTVNVPEGSLPPPDRFSFPLRVRANGKPKGFGANHNAAFTDAQGEFFCVLNPDIRLAADPFPGLLDDFRNEAVGAVAPLIVNPAGGIENSARRFPTAISILRKAVVPAESLDYSVENGPFFPDWVGGMFIIFRRKAFVSVSGFDEAYFLYYEDVDLCARMRRQGWRIMVDPSLRAVHDARRESHRNFRYLNWHLRSMMRFLLRRLSGRV